MRLYNTITKSTLFYTSNTVVMDSEDSEDQVIKYDRNFNIKIGDNLPCVTKVDHAWRIRNSEISNVLVDVEYSQKDLKINENVGLETDIGVDMNSHSFSKAFYIPPIQSSKAEVEEIISSIKNPVQDQKISILKWGIYTSEGWVTYLTQEQLESEQYSDLANNKCAVIVSGAFAWNEDNHPYVYSMPPNTSTSQISTIDPPPSSMHRLIIPAVCDKNGCVALIVYKNPNRVAIPNPQAEASPPPILLPMCLPVQFLNDYVAGKFELSKMKKTDFASKEVLYRVPPLVNNVTQKTYKNIFTLERYANWKKSNGGITKFALSKSRAKSKVMSQIVEEVKDQINKENIKPSSTKKIVKTD